MRDACAGGSCNYYDDVTWLKGATTHRMFRSRCFIKLLVVAAPAGACVTHSASETGCLVATWIVPTSTATQLMASADAAMLRTKCVVFLEF